MGHPRLFDCAVPTQQNINRFNDSIEFESETINVDEKISHVRPCMTSSYDLAKLINCEIKLQRVDKYNDCTDFYSPVFQIADIRFNKSK